jgi:hypothetical protein
MLLMELEASLPSLMAQPASFSSALARVCRGLERAGSAMRQQKPGNTLRHQPRSARPARKKPSTVERPMSLPLFP